MGGSKSAKKQAANSDATPGKETGTGTSTATTPVPPARASAPESGHQLVTASGSVHSAGGVGGWGCGLQTTVTQRRMSGSKCVCVCVVGGVEEMYRGTLPKRQARCSGGEAQLMTRANITG